MKTSSTAAVRGILPLERPSRSSANASRKPNAVRSARNTAPATFHCTFSKVAQNIAAKKKNGKSLDSRVMRPSRAARPAPRPAFCVTAGAAARRSGSRSAAAQHASAHGGRATARGPRDDVLEPGGGERLQERPRVALAEEAARVGEPKALARVVFQAREVVEVAPVRDDAHLAGRLESPHLVRDRLGDGDDGVG